jgi:amino acid adenylation domain-containing protein
MNHAVSTVRQPELSPAHIQVSTQAALRPDAVAVSGSQGALTFRQLDEESNRLARHIRALGAGAEVPIGLFFERSPPFVVAALAALKAGAAYVPLDPTNPPDRIHAILKDAGAPVLLSHKWMAASLPGGPWTVVDLDVDAARIRSHSGEPLDVDVAGTDLAYLIYTSGSTGQPKGVEVSHSNLTHLIDWHRRAFSITPADRASQISGLGFDATVWETWCHLAAGASLHMIDETSRRSAEGLRDWLVANEITVSFVPPVMAEHLIRFEWPAATALRILLTGADTLHRYPKAGLPFRVINNYGPTECTVLVSSGEIRSDSTPHRLPSIGRPIEDTCILVLDANLQPVAPGERGELCVTGPQVARGYRNSPELTAQKFVMDNSAPGGRLYRTGDIGYFLPDGELAFCGRLDDQIKIRGFRVEPDEIVARLNEHPEIRNSVVVARNESSLAAYVVFLDGSSLSDPALREFLRSRLPDYSIPSVFVRLDSIPMTSTGKCDKAALPAPSRENMLGGEGDRSAMPQNTEERVAQLVSGLLDSRHIDRHENFFMAGGHSMLAAQLLARIRESFGARVTLRQLFEAPTVADLTAVVEEHLRSH